MVNSHSLTPNATENDRTRRSEVNISPICDNLICVSNYYRLSEYFFKVMPMFTPPNVDQKLADSNCNV